MCEQTPAQRLAEEYKAGDPHIRTLGMGTYEEVVEFVLAKIHARREELRNGPVSNRDTFWFLFDDGAEFGPPKRGPTFRMRDDGEWVEIVTLDGLDQLVTPEAYRAIQEGPKLEEIE